MRNLETVNHIRKTVELVDRFGKFLNLTKTQSRDLHLSAKYHDIGKKYIDQEILYKKGKLNNNEFDELKKHPNISYAILESVGIFNKFVLDAVIQHHERIDGRGYPLGLEGSQISYLAKILSICDSYEAMTAERCYKKALTRCEAIEEVRKCLGTQFDRELGLEFIRFIELELGLVEQGVFELKFPEPINESKRSNIRYAIEDSLDPDGYNNHKLSKECLDKLDILNISAPSNLMRNSALISDNKRTDNILIDVGRISKS